MILVVLAKQLQGGWLCGIEHHFDCVLCHENVGEMQLTVIEPSSFQNKQSRNHIRQTPPEAVHDEIRIGQEVFPYENVVEPLFNAERVIIEDDSQKELSCIR